MHPTLEEIVEIGAAAGPGIVVSSYVNTTIEEGFDSLAVGRFKAKADRGLRVLPIDHPDRPIVERNLFATREVLDGPEAHRAMGAAVFAAVQRGFLRAYFLNHSPSDQVVFSSEPYLVPLLAGLCQQSTYLVVLADSHQAFVYSASPAEQRLVEHVGEDVPERQRAGSERWGPQQATIARRRENVILRFHQRLADALERQWAQSTYDGIAILGPHEEIRHLREHLARRLTDRIVHEGPWNRSWAEADLGRVVASLAARIARSRNQALLREVHERIHQGFAVARGPVEVVDALQTGRVAPQGHGRVILGPDTREAVARCRECRLLSCAMPSFCPRCGAPCVQASLWEEILFFCHRHKISVQIVEPDSLLERQEGVVALLSR